MKLPVLRAHIINSLWAILPEKLEEIVGVLDAYELGTVEMAAAANRRPVSSVVQGNTGGQVAVMNLFGTISQRQNMLASASGGTSSQVFAADFKRNIEDPNVGAVLIVSDSPGGMVAGTQELSDLIYSSRGKKPIWALADPSSASGAYWISSSVDPGGFIAAPSAQTIGSIGVVQMLMDQTKALEKAGVTMNIIRSTENKFEGNPYEPLSAAAKAHFQARVDESHQLFVSSIARNRGVSVATVNDRFGKGSTFMAREAVDRGMVDRIATFETVLSELSAKVGTASSVFVSADIPKGREHAMHPKVRLALVQSGLATFAMSAADLTAAVDTLFAAHSKAVPQDHDECAKQIRALCATEAAPAAEIPAPPAAPAVPAPAQKQPACDMVSIAGVHAIVMTAGAALSAQDKLTVVGELQTKISAAGGSLAMSDVLDFVNKKAVAATADTGSNVRIEAGEAQIDKFRDEATAAMCLAGTPSLSGKFVNPRTGEEQDFKRPKGLKSSALAIARECMVQAGVPAGQVMHLDANDVAMCVMGGSYMAQRRAEDLFGRQMAAGWGNVTGMYLNLLYDAGNVQLRKAYGMVSTTYQQWAVKIDDFTDFKTKHLVTVGAFPDPTAIGEDGEFDEVGTVDGRETLTIHEWGQKFTYSYKLLVNETLGGLIGKHTGQMANAMKRKQNRLVYGILKDNRALADGVALFDSTAVASGGHANLTTGSVSDYGAALNTVKQKLQAQKAPGAGAAPIGLKMRYLLHPPALYQNFRELFGSPNKISGTTPGIPNVWQGTAEPIEEDELSAAFGGSDTAWYAVGDGAACEHIVYATMAGQNGPIFSVFEIPGVLGYGSTIHQAFGAGAVDYRNIQKHAGA